ncbi:unnamed protein product [Calypogeia fissa]
MLLRGLIAIGIRSASSSSFSAVAAFSAFSSLLKIQIPSSSSSSLQTQIPRLKRGGRCHSPPLLRADSLGGGSLLLHAAVVPKKAGSAAATTMAENEAGGVAQEPEAESNAPDRTTQPKELGKLASSIMPHILNLYSLKATAVDYDIYAPNATFEDPLMKAKGVKQIKSAFYSMPKIFSEGEISEYDVKETETAPGSGEIIIDNMQHYKVWGKAIDMKSLIKLQMENGKVTRHEDLWDKNPLWSRDTVKVPLVGRATEGWRRFNMLVTHAIMGFGKDPKPKN